MNYQLIKHEISSLKKEAEELRITAEKDVNAIAEDLYANWDSEAGNAYYKEITELKDEMIKTANMLDEAADRLNALNNQSSSML